MRLPPSELARYNLRWWPHCVTTISASSAESMPIGELLSLADPEAGRLFEELRLDYARPEGLPELREAIAAEFETVSLEGTLTFAGAQEAIFAVTAGLLEPGDHVVVITPIYEPLHALPAAFSGHVTEVALRHEEGWRLSLGQVEAALRPETKLLVLNFPHNPTGATIAAGELRTLVEMAARSGTRVLSDEVFRGLDPDPLPPAADLYERAISLDVMSKAYGLGGVRVGWIATRDERVLAAARDVKAFTSICNGGADEVLALIALRARERILSRNRRILAKNREVLEGFLSRNSERLSVALPRSGCLAFPRLRAGRAAEMAERTALCAGVLVLPGGLFRGDEAHLRLGFGRRDFPEALARFEEVLTPA